MLSLFWPHNSRFFFHLSLWFASAAVMDNIIGYERNKERKRKQPKQQQNIIWHWHSAERVHRLQNSRALITFHIYAWSRTFYSFSIGLYLGLFVRFSQVFTIHLPFAFAAGENLWFLCCLLTRFHFGFWSIFPFAAFTNLSWPCKYTTRQYVMRSHWIHCCWLCCRHRRFCCCCCCCCW